jgi:hypothetical protein
MRNLGVKDGKKNWRIFLFVIIIAYFKEVMSFSYGGRDGHLTGSRLHPEFVERKSPPPLRNS